MPVSLCHSSMSSASSSQHPVCSRHPANCIFQQRVEPRQKQLKMRYRRTDLPQRGFSSFRHRARIWSRQRRICYKAEHTAAGTNLRFLVTNCAGRASQTFAFYNDRGECENRIEEFMQS
jgi:DDE family transposase